MAQGMRNNGNNADETDENQDAVLHAAAKACEIEPALMRFNPRLIAVGAIYPKSQAGQCYSRAKSLVARGRRAYWCCVLAMPIGNLLDDRVTHEVGGLVTPVLQCCTVWGPQRGVCCQVDVLQSHAHSQRMRQKQDDCSK